METASESIVCLLETPDLNDDCWLHIFSFLPAKDLIRMEQVCKRWQRIVLMTRKNITISASRINVFEEILKKHGNSIIGLSCDFEDLHSPSSMFQLKNKYCSIKLLHLFVSFEKFFMHELDVVKFPFLKNLKSLRILTFSNSLYLSSFSNIMSILEKHDSLKYFSMLTEDEDFQIGYYDKKHILYIGNIDIDKDFNWEQLFQLFWKMSDYKEGEKLRLRLSNVSNFYVDSLIPILNHLTDLELSQMFETDCFVRLRENCLKKLQFQNFKILKLCNLKFINDDIILIFVRNCPLLEKVKIEEDPDRITGEGFRHLANLKGLKYLRVLVEDISCDALKFIAASCSKLKAIYCWTGLMDFTADKLNSIVSSLPNLKFITLQGFEQLTNECLKSVLESVRKRRNKKKLHIRFIGTVMTEVVNQLILKNASLCSDSASDYVIISACVESIARTNFFVINN